MKKLNELRRRNLTVTIFSLPVIIGFLILNVKALAIGQLFLASVAMTIVFTTIFWAGTAFKLPKKHKEIELTKYEKMWIKFCKGHYKDKYRTNANDWITSLKPLFEEIYGYSPDKYPKDFRRCMYIKLMDIFMKIKEPHSNNMYLHKIIGASFQQDIVRDYEEPVERVIAELCGQIQCVTVIDDEGNKRFDLNIDEDENDSNG